MPQLPLLTALAQAMSRRSNRVPLLALLLAGVLSAFLTVQLVDARRQQELRARQEAQNIAALLEARLLAGVREIDVTLRSLAVDQSADLKAAKHWVVPVRAWARNDEWQGADGEPVGSHDADGLVRPAYVQAMLDAGLYDNKGTLKDGLLDPDCIEAREWNLSAGQYKPFDFTQLKSDKSVADLIGALKTTEQDIIQGLDKLLAMVEGRK